MKPRQLLLAAHDVGDDQELLDDAHLDQVVVLCAQVLLHLLAARLAQLAREALEADVLLAVGDDDAVRALGVLGQRHETREATPLAAAALAEEARDLASRVGVEDVVVALAAALDELQHLGAAQARLLPLDRRRVLVVDRRRRRCRHSRRRRASRRSEHQQPDVVLRTKLVVVNYQFR